MTDNHPYDENEQIIERLDTLLDDHFDTVDTVEAISIDFPVKFGTSNVLPADIILPTYELNAYPSVLVTDHDDLDIFCRLTR